MQKVTVIVTPQSSNDSKLVSEFKQGWNGTAVPGTATGIALRNGAAATVGFGAKCIAGAASFVANTARSFVVGGNAPVQQQAQQTLEFSEEDLKAFLAWKASR